MELSSLNNLHAKNILGKFHLIWPHGFRGVSVDPRTDKRTLLFMTTNDGILRSLKLIQKHSGLR